MFRRPVLRIVAQGVEWLDVRSSAAVKTSLAVPGSDDRIVLLFWSLSTEPRFRNVARIDPQGFLKWRASLPGETQRDCFVSLERCGEAFLARTYAGHELRFDADGSDVAA